MRNLLLRQGKDPGRIIVTILGIMGAMLGGWIIWLYGPDARAGFFMAVLGSITLLALIHARCARTTSIDQFGHLKEHRASGPLEHPSIDKIPD